MERRIFTVRGRVVHANGAPAPQTWVSIVDADPDHNDDLLGVGVTNAEGGFRLSFTTEAFNQEPDERQTVPRLYVVLAGHGKAGPVPVVRHDLGVFAWANDEDVGTLALPLLPVGEPLPGAGLRHAPGSGKLVRRIHLDDAIVAMASREIAPIVERLTGWSGLLDGLRIEIVDSSFDVARRRAQMVLGRNDLSDQELERLMRGAQSCDSGFAALWEPALRTVVLNRPVLERWSLDVLKVTLGHELVHVGQSRLHPEMDARLNALQARSVKARLAGDRDDTTSDEWRFMANLEGYAHYIETKYLLAIYTHGVQIASLAADAAAPAQEPRQAVIAVPSVAPSLKELEEMRSDSSFFYTATKSHQYGTGMAAYLARTVGHEPAPFDPLLEPELILDPTVLALLCERALNGCVASQSAVGLLFYKGEGGIAKDDKQAAFWFRMAAEGGLPVAAHMLAVLLPDGHPEEVRWFRVAAEWGLAEAQRCLARALLREGSPDYAPAEAVVWLGKAAEQGDADAMMQLSGLLLLGEQIAPDHAAAIAWAIKAAELGAVKAMRLLAELYKSGQIVKQDLISARLWQKRADAAEAKQTRIAAPCS